ncbi:hypothetical protein QYF36_020538 [Acer negundo]|nr:hypothetical protein QYF36_020538 [Acer negundo]
MTGANKGVLLGNRVSEETKTDTCGSLSLNRKDYDASTVGNISRNAYKNLGDILANKEVNQSLPRKVAGQQQISSRQFRKDDMLVKVCVEVNGLDTKGGPENLGPAEESHLDVTSKTSHNVQAEGVNMGMGSAEMEVDRDIHKSSNLEVATESVGPAKVQHGPKAGKWKMWARDGVKIDSGMDGASSLWKRSACKIGSNSRKKQKVVTTEDENCSEINELSMGRSLLAYRS